MEVPILFVYVKSIPPTVLFNTTISYNPKMFAIILEIFVYTNVGIVI